MQQLLVPWSAIVSGPSRHARLAGRMTVLGVVLTVLGALCLTSPLIALLASRPPAAMTTVS